MDGRRARPARLDAALARAWAARKSESRGIQGDAEASGAAAAEALVLFEAEGETAACVDCLNALATSAIHRDEIASARAHLERSAGLARTLDDPFRVGAAVGNLGAIAMYERDFGGAQRSFEEAVEISRALGKHEALASSLTNVALCASQIDDFEKAAAFARESLHLHAQLEDAPGLIYALIAAETILVQRQEWALVATVAAATTALADAVGLEIEPFERDLHDRAAQLAACNLSSEAHDAAAEEGLELGRAELMSVALNALD